MGVRIIAGRVGLVAAGGRVVVSVVGGDDGDVGRIRVGVVVGVSFGIGIGVGVVVVGVVVGVGGGVVTMRQSIQAFNKINDAVVASPLLLPSLWELLLLRGWFC